MMEGRHKRIYAEKQVREGQSGEEDGRKVEGGRWWGEV